MNANRKADLQRKLTLAPIPKPPAGLAERIKREIPKQLRFNAEKERERFSKAIGFNLRVAASILLLISSAFLGLQLLTRLHQEQQPTAVTAARRVAPAPAAPTTAPAAEKDQPKLAKNKPKRRVQIAAARHERENVVAQAPAAAPPPVVMAETETVSRAAKSTGLVALAMRDQNEARGALLDRFDQPDSQEASVDQETVISPISGKMMLRVSGGAPVAGARRIVSGSVTSLFEVDAAPTVTPWAAASRRTKVAVLVAEWMRGGDRLAIARIAREAGLNELADAVSAKR